MGKWHGIMQILEICHWRGEQLLRKDEKISNLLHYDGEEFILRAAFTGGQESEVIPENYYLGLDNRSVIHEANDITSLVGEPASSGYTRQAVSSADDFTIATEDNHFRAISPIVTFTASSGSWGPVQNLFLTDQNDNSGYLIATAQLPSPLTVEDGDSVTMRLAMTLKDCS